MRSLLSLFNKKSVPSQPRKSISALLGRSQPVPQVLNARTEDIPALMLHELGDYGERKFPAVVRRVRYALDVQGLWCARSDVMVILANTYGETIARDKLVHIDARFNGLTPKSLTVKNAFRPR